MLNKRLRKAALFVLLLLIKACASYKGEQAYEIKKNLEYTKYADGTVLTCDVYLPKGDGPFPAILSVHGGGWSSRTREDMKSIAESLASQGFVVLNISHRFAPEYKHPAQLEDITKAMDFFAAHALEWHADMSRLGAWGYSSGGHLVSLFSLKESLNEKSTFKFKAIVAGGAPLDLAWYPQSPIINKYLGDYRDKMFERYVEASPTTYLSEKAPAFFLYHGVEDRLVEFAQTTNFESKLKTLRVPTESHYVKFWGHALTFILDDESVKQGIGFLKRKL